MIKIIILNKVDEICCCSITKSCQTLCDPMDCSIPGSSVLCYLGVCSKSYLLSWWCWGMLVKNPPARSGDMRGTGLIPGGEGALEEGRATHPSILAWRTPWTEEPGGLQSLGSHSQIQMKQLSTRESNHLLICGPLCIRHFFF